ncbi:aminoglycoside phosphotransferase family protein [Nocardioides sp. BGMRC 2183]|nr:aminoglycoside phosphotransferase family protein [Nocardioides sp. BGMRC 2183]
MPGGWSGETFLAQTHAERSVVRIFADPRHRQDAPELQAALLHLVRGLLPVPGVREVRRRRDAETPGLLVTEHLPGVRADLFLADADAAARTRLGAAFGTVAATLAAMPTLRAGTWADADLRIEPCDLDVAGWVERCRAGLAGRGWAPEALAGLGELALRADDLLAALDRTCLVHSDLNPKNLLVDPDTLTVTGVVDWEFSHSGHPWTDLGNLIRFDRDPRYVTAVLDAWCARHGGPPDVVRAGARAADLVALVELATRAGENPVTDAAVARLHEAVADPDGYLS